MNWTESPELTRVVNQKNQELLPCPFCGDSAELNNTHTAHYWVECVGCEARVSNNMPLADSDSEKLHLVGITSAVENWNRRYPL